MRFYDLFCGIGGFRKGLEDCDSRFTHIGSCEINKYAREIYAKNFDKPPTDEDVRLLDPSSLPDFDLLTAGFPCQAFSIAGKRLGFNDTRGTMFFEIARIVKEKRPQTLFLENVKGLLNHDGGRTFITILNTLDELGYDVEWQVINGKYFVPQNRERVFIIGHTRDKPFRKIFPLREGSSIDDESFKETQTEGQWIWGPYTRALDSNYAKGGGSRTMIKVLDDCYDVKGIAPTMLTMGCGGNRIKTYQEKIRSLTPLECERLMGFPDGWTEGISNVQRYKCLGNAVIPLVVKEIAKHFIY